MCKSTHTKCFHVPHTVGKKLPYDKTYPSCINYMGMIPIVVRKYHIMFFAETEMENHHEALVDSQISY